MNQFQEYDTNNYFEGGQRRAENLPQYLAKTFGWMALGLLTTFGTALLTAAGIVNQVIPFNMGILSILSLAEIIVAVTMGARFYKMSPAGVKACFFGYAVLNGVTFSTIFIAFDMTSLVMIFGLTALYFGGMAAYGYFTKSDLSRFGPLLFGGLLFLLVGGLLGLVFNIGGFNTLMCIVGMIVFMGYTAFDIQRIKSYYLESEYDNTMGEKLSVYGAMQLYLDFINMFLYLLRLFGRSDD